MLRIGDGASAQSGARFADSADPRRILGRSSTYGGSSGAEHSNSSFRCQAMIRLPLWQGSSFQRSLASHSWKYGLLKRSSLRDCSFRCRFSTSNSSLVPTSRKGVLAQKSSKSLSRTIEPVSSPPRKPATYEPLKEQLATRSSPTILYRASSYTHYIVACYTSGIFFVCCAISNYGTKKYAHLQDVPSYVPVFITVGSLFLACFGFWMFLKVRQSIV